LLNQKEIKVVELFAGVGGFRLGLENTSRHYNIVWSNEIDKYAASIYRYQFSQGNGNCSNNTRELQTEGKLSTKRKGVEGEDGKGSISNSQSASVVYDGTGYWHEPSGMYEGDIRAVEPESIPSHDLICAGFPCQSFSIAGKRGGFGDIRGTMFFEICRIARACGTKYLFLENVKGLLNHQGGATFQTIISTLDELGYDCQWQVLNSKNYGVPQNRERVFIIANLRTEPRPQVFPIGENTGGIDERVYETAVGALSAGGHSGGMHSNMTLIHNVYGGFGESEPRIFEDISPTIRTPKGGGHLPMVAHTVRTGGKASGIDAKQNWDTYQVGGRIRRLTPIECERLQAFPDNWTKYGIDKSDKQIEISDTQRYKVMGNAVTTSVITAIGKAIIQGFEEGKC
jgi:DNA-cytosine methyltransferase